MSEPYSININATVDANACELYPTALVDKRNIFAIAKAVIEYPVFLALEVPEDISEGDEPFVARYDSNNLINCTENVYHMVAVDHSIAPPLGVDDLRSWQLWVNSLDPQESVEFVALNMDGIAEWFALCVPSDRINHCLGQLTSNRQRILVSPADEREEFIRMLAQRSPCTATWFSNGS
jgi:hypothetical protein